MSHYMIEMMKAARGWQMKQSWRRGVSFNDWEASQLSSFQTGEIVSLGNKLLLIGTRQS